jgi:integrase
LTRRELVAVIVAVEADGRPGAAIELRKHLRTLLEWTTNHGLTSHNVLAGLRREKATRAQRLEEAEHGKALSDEELARVWRASDPTSVFGRYLRALILTGCRRAELSKLEWTMVAGDRLIIPSTHTKQGRAHEIPIVPALRALLEACPRTTSPLVFPSPITGRALRGWAKAVDMLRERSGVQFTLHDLRRTFRSGLTRLGVDHDTAEMAIGHQRDDLVRRYDKHDRWPARVEAAERWAKHVLDVVTEPEPTGNVVRLRA